MPSPSVLITGSSTGIGRAAVTEFLEAGWQVFASLRRSQERRSEFDHELDRFGSALRLLELDVCSAVEREAVASEILEWGPLHCLVNNAGYGLFGALEDLDEDQLREVMETNFFAPALFTRRLLPALRKAQGCVLNVSSVMGRAGAPLNSGYCSSKFALEGLSECLYYELKPHGVRVGIIEPGGHRTQFAQSVRWAGGDSPAYRAATAAYKSMLRRLSTRVGGSPPDGVAKRIVELASAKRVPLRRRIGADAGAMALLEVLPPRARHKTYELLWGQALRPPKQRAKEEA